MDAGDHRARRQVQQRAHAREEPPPRDVRQPQRASGSSTRARATTTSSSTCTSRTPRTTPPCPAGSSSTRPTARATTSVRCCPGLVMPDKKLPAGWRPGEGWLYKADTLDDLARRDRPRSRCAAQDGRAVQRLRTDRGRRGLPPRRQRQRPLLLRPAREAQPDPRADREGAVLRGAGDARATSAPRRAWSPTTTAGSSTGTTGRSPASTAPATRRRR